MKRNRVLLVDDDINMLGSWSNNFNMAGFDTSSASSAGDAISIFNNLKPNIVVTDFHMPGMNGLELFKRLKKIDATIPLIMVSGTDDMQVAVQAIKEQAFDFLSKPVSFDILLSVVKSALSRKKKYDETEPEKFKRSKINHEIISGSKAISHVSVHCSLDEYNKANFLKAISVLTQEGVLQDCVVFSFKYVDYINNVGLNFLIDTYKELQSKGMKLAFTELSDPVFQYLKVLGYLDYFEIEESLEAAAWQLQSGA